MVFCAVASFPSHNIYVYIYTCVWYDYIIYYIYIIIHTLYYMYYCYYIFIYYFIYTLYYIYIVSVWQYIYNIIYILCICIYTRTRYFVDQNSWGSAWTCSKASRCCWARGVFFVHRSVERPRSSKTLFTDRVKKFSTAPTLFCNAELLGGFHKTQIC